MEHGVDGFRVDAVPFLYEREDLKDEPLSNWGYEYPNYYYLNHLYTMDQPESFDVLTVWQELIDNYTQIANDGKVRTMFTEGYVNMSFILDTYDAGVDMPFNFRFINAGEIAHPAVVSTATDIVDIIETWMSQMPDDKTANWVVSILCSNALFCILPVLLHSFNRSVCEGFELMKRVSSVLTRYFCMYPSPPLVA